MSRIGYLNRAQELQDAAWDRDRLEQKISPGSAEEASALARIDELRDEERRLSEPFERSRRRRLSKTGGRPFGGFD